MRYCVTTVVLLLICMPQWVWGQSSLEIEEVRIDHGDIQLAGSLYLPEGCVACPGLVLLGGGSSTTRERQAPFAERFARAGIASLIYDKRGTGESTGNFDARSFADMASDGLAAFRALRVHEKIDPAQVGLWGGSEGGALALMAAAQAPSVAFVVNLAGPVEHFRAGRLMALREQMHDAALPEAQQAAIVALWHQYYDDAADGFIAASTLEEIRRWHADGLDASAPPVQTQYPPEANPHVRSFAHLHRLSVLDRLGMPVFMLYGEYDELVPDETNLAIIQHAFGEAGKTNFDVHVYPKASHAFTTPEGTLVPEFFETQINWVQQQVNK